MTVYIVYSYTSYEGSNVESVHLTREGAQKFVDASCVWRLAERAMAGITFDQTWCDGLCIEETEVKP